LDDKKFRSRSRDRATRWLHRRFEVEQLKVECVFESNEDTVGLCSSSKDPNKKYLIITEDKRGVVPATAENWWKVLHRVDENAKQHPTEEGKNKTAQVIHYIEKKFRLHASTYTTTTQERALVKCFYNYHARNGLMIKKGEVYSHTLIGLSDSGVDDTEEDTDFDNADEDSVDQEVVDDVAEKKIAKYALKKEQLQEDSERWKKEIETLNTEIEDIENNIEAEYQRLTRFGNTLRDAINEHFN
jgi:hypothetical protein